MRKAFELRRYLWPDLTKLTIGHLYRRSFSLDSTASFKYLWMNAKMLKSMESVEFWRRDNDGDNYLRSNFLAPYLVQLGVTTNWKLHWHRGTSARVSDGGFCWIESHFSLLLHWIRGFFKTQLFSDTKWEKLYFIPVIPVTEFSRSFFYPEVEKYTSLPSHEKLLHLYYWRLT